MPNKGKIVLAKMDTPWGISRNARRIANLLLDGQISAAKATSLNGLLGTILKCVELTALDERLVALELKMLKDKGRF